MLVNNQQQYEKGDLVSFKLANGDEIVAEIVESTGFGWTIKKPCVVVPSQQGIGLMQALFTGKVDANMDLSKNSVLLHAETVAELHSHYWKTTTGFELAPKASIAK